ncbi:MAG: hypothetical protein SGPRY_006655, partial [Prymnesium sp.]
GKGYVLDASHHRLVLRAVEQAAAVGWREKWGEGGKDEDEDEVGVEEEEQHEEEEWEGTGKGREKRDSGRWERGRETEPISLLRVLSEEVAAGGEQSPVSAARE